MHGRTYPLLELHSQLKTLKEFRTVDVLDYNEVYDDEDDCGDTKGDF